MFEDGSYESGQAPPWWRWYTWPNWWSRVNGVGPHHLEGPNRARKERRTSATRGTTSGGNFNFGTGKSACPQNSWQPFDALDRPSIP